MKPYLKLSLICGLTLAGTRTLQAQERPERRPTVTVRVYNYAHIDRTTLSTATQYATQIFKDSGIDLVWVAAVRTEQVELAADEMERTIIIVPHVSPAFARRSQTMGAANPGGYSAQVFDDRVDLFAKAFSATVSFPYPAKRIVLGHAMAHELGHLFSLSHSDTGIMKAEWDCDDYWRAATRNLRFVPEQSRSILDQIRRRAGSW